MSPLMKCQRPLYCPEGGYTEGGRGGEEIKREDVYLGKRGLGRTVEGGMRGQRREDSRSSEIYKSVCHTYHNGVCFLFLWYLS